MEMATITYFDGFEERLETSHAHDIEAPATRTSPRMITHSPASNASNTSNTSSFLFGGHSTYQAPVCIVCGQRHAGSCQSGAPESSWRLFTGVWWPNTPHHAYQNLDVTMAYHSRTRLSMHRDGLLLDIGAVFNLAGELFMARQAERAKEFGLSSTRQSLKQELGVEGVGSGSQTCTESMTVPCALEGAQLGEFTAPIVPKSEIPALLGLKSMQEKRVLIDTYNHYMYMVGPGGYKLQLSPGSKRLTLEEAPSGHLLLPISDFEHVCKTHSNSEQASPTSKTLTFATKHDS
eukprot:9380555-Karenia_brevis.AAC.1